MPYHNPFPSKPPLLPLLPLPHSPARIINRAGPTLTEPRCTPVHPAASRCIALYCNPSTCIVPVLYLYYTCIVLVLYLYCNPSTPGCISMHHIVLQSQYLCCICIVLVLHLYCTCIATPVHPVASRCIALYCNPLQYQAMQRAHKNLQYSITKKFVAIL